MSPTNILDFVADQKVVNFFSLQKCSRTEHMVPVSLVVPLQNLLHSKILS